MVKLRKIDILKYSNVNIANEMPELRSKFTKDEDG